MIAMKKLCAWCRKIIHQGSGAEGDRVSHGICGPCRDYFFSQCRPPDFDGFLDKLDVPVIVIDEEVRVVTANEMARNLLGKRCQDLNGIDLGDAIECAYARLPEGCGRAVHCRSCAVRLTVLDSFRTGRSHYDVPAYHDLCFHKMERSVCYLVSTEKSGDFVFLRILEVKSGECEQGKSG